MLNELQQQYPQYQASLPGQQFAWLKKIRQEAFELFMQQGLPNIRTEEWKYTNLLPVSRQTYSFANKNATTNNLPASLFKTTRLVFIDGCFNESLSNLNVLPKGVQVNSLAEALAEANPVLLAHWQKNAPLNNSAITALNISCAADGAVVILPENCQAGLIEICFFSSDTGNKKIIQARNIILGGAGSSATVVEHYCGDDAASNLTNNITELFLAENANVQHIKIQSEPKDCVHIGQLYVDQKESSLLQSYVLSYGGSLVRNQIHDLLNGQKSSAELYGLFIAKDYQHMDQHTTIEHIKPECTSHEFYRGILLDNARGIFSGNVLVHPNAPKSSAKQVNNNLLLSPNAEIDTKPELQIYTDDVQCSHGATVGKLDEQALFYLRARGLNYEQARSLLIYTFAAEVLKNLTDKNIRDTLQQQILTYLPVTAWLQEICHDI